MQMHRTILIAATLAGMALLLALDQWHRARFAEKNHAQLERTLQESVRELEQRLEIRILAVDDLRAFLLALPEAPDQSAFDAIATQLLRNYPALRTLQFVGPDHLIRFTYPLTGNEDAVGLDLMTRPAAPYVERAMATRMTVLNEPTVTVQGVLAVVARSPLYAGDTYLGLTQGVIEINTLLEEVAAHLPTNVSYAVALEGALPFWGTEPAGAARVSAPVRAGDRIWTASLGWAAPPPGADPSTIALIWGLGGLALTSILALVHLALRRVTRLSQSATESAQALHASETRFRVLFEHAFEGILIAEAGSGKIVYANPALCGMLGHPEDALSGACLKRTLAVRDQDSAPALPPADALDGGSVQRTDVACPHADGSTVFVDITWTHMQLDGTAYHVGFFRDIGDRKRVEAQSEAALAQLQLTVQATNIGLWDWDLLTNEVYLSPEWKRQLGYEDSELPNEYAEWESRIHPEDRAQVLAAIAAAAQPPFPPYAPEFRLRHRDGSYRWLLVRGKVLHDAHGAPFRMLGCHIDITDRRQAEEELRAATDLRERTLESLSEVVIVVDPATRTIQQCNAAAERVFGYCADELIGKSTEILHVDRARYEAFARASEPMLERGEAFHASFEMRRKDGTLIQTENTVATLSPSKGWRAGVVSVVRDVTGQRQLESRLRQAQKMEAIGTLAGGIAHDFNNILAAIIGYSELVQAQLDPGSEEYGDLEGVLAAANRAQSLVQQILTFSRQVEEVRQPVDLVEVVEEALKLLRPSIPTTIEIEANVGDSPQPVLADPTQMHQVIVNLCTNAYQAMEESGGRLSIALGRTSGELPPELPPGEYVRMVVRDTGCGMDPAYLYRVFDPFYTTKPQGKGTGLGLATVHGIITAHGGAITVQSAPGSGSTFEVFLPFATEPVLPAPGEEPPVRGGSERLLLVDDEEALANLLQKALEKFGYNVHALTSSTAALELLKQEPGRFDLLVTDLTMPRMTGRQLIAEVRGIRPDLPVILVTGFSDNGLLEDLARLGVSTVLTKPVKPRNLARIVRDVLDAGAFPANAP
ncbi:MAG: PAS domain S-box protein [Candidatus Hydrogenedentes bacterium]|nr:PAS domain S-box protein [Candidatus Hydrogenedentota bacterium]